MKLFELLQPSIERHADLVAVIDGTQVLTYRDLQDRSAAVARDLDAAGLQPLDRVCLLMPKSISALVATLGVIRAGGVYVPLDCGSPLARLRNMLDRIGPCWLIGDERHAPLLQQILSLEDAPPLFGAFSIDGEELQHTDVTNITERGKADETACVDDLLYIIFTSGSTGTPKGVPISHESLVQYIRWSNDHFKLSASDRIASHAPLHFDISVSDIFGAWAAGAAIHLVPPSANLTPTVLAQFIRDSAVNQWYSVPSPLIAMAARDVLTACDFPTLKRVTWGGEAFPVNFLRYWMQRVPHANFTNVYGPTEGTINCTFFPVTAVPKEGESSVPIGRPIPGRRLMVANEAGQPLPDGEVGQLYLGGEGLSPGYWRDEARSAESFVSLPEGGEQRWYKTGDLAHRDSNGYFHFHGRADRQIKSRGYRIELDEVSFALASLPDLAESAVVAISVGGFEGMQICAAYVPKESRACSPASLKAALAASLPSYMLPRQWRQVNGLPRNVNGKIDLKQVQALFETK